ncbi:MAG: tRNA (N(6)-L-threonylcarbamoyladenosine(37)-C(2))-methylthiotransferase MtaB [candidate division Zixibacteria bacterium]|nr:tRNA (N(6)-L-threonylcarbamoyladenosine(37)-C(2))-methylthiotransferase MtaB [candidate division Zixibacteria bacterium]
MKQPRASFYTLGCRLNQAETALIAETFRERGYEIAEHGSPVEVAVINTCSVTEHADQRCRQEIRKVKRRSPSAVVCAVGCYAQADTQTVAGILGVDYVVGTDKKYALAQIVSQDVSGSPRPSYARGLKPLVRNSEVRPAPREEMVSSQVAPAIFVSQRPDTGEFDYPMAGYYPHSTRANIKIQDGCDFCCAFCLLPRVRGAAHSRSLEQIVAEGHELVRRGHKELVITGVNIGTYNSGGKTVSDVARAISELPGVQRVRISSIEPSTIGDELLDWMAGSPKACRHLHLPLQSGDDSVLARMKRVYTAGEYARFIERAKTLMPDLGLGTDIIVGFPGESDREFDQTLRFVEQLPLSYLHVFSYSERPKTAAAFYGDKIDPARIKERSERMHEVAARKKQAFFDEHIGRKVEVLFETVDEDGWRKGFTGSYLRVGTTPDACGENKIVRVTVMDTTDDFCLAGEPFDRISIDG